MENIILTKSSKSLLKVINENNLENFHIDELKELTALDVKKIESDLDYLKSKKLVNYISFYRIVVTADGENWFKIQSEIMKDFLLKSLAIPVVVSALTTLITIFIHSLLNKG